MATQHAKSPCCRRSIWHFGNRRRQCSFCKRTWRIRRKRRGCKKYRPARGLLMRILLERYSFAHEKKRSSLTTSGLSRRLHKALVSVAIQPYPHHRLPHGQYALVGDGLWFRFKRTDWVMYLMAVKPAHYTRAYFLDPVLLVGRERYDGWQQAVASIPHPVKKRICAFVSDGFRGSQLLAQTNGWIHQRCHFHLLAALVRGKGRKQYRVRSDDLRTHLLEATKVLLNSTNNAILQRTRETIHSLINRAKCPTYIRKQALEFLEREHDFRIYLRYPRLHLPTTTNVIESTGRIMRQATRTACTPNSLLLRATAFLRLKSSLMCNGKKSQPN